MRKEGLGLGVYTRNDGFGFGLFILELLYAKKREHIWLLLLSEEDFYYVFVSKR